MRPAAYPLQSRATFKICNIVTIIKQIIDLLFLFGTFFSSFFLNKTLGCHLLSGGLALLKARPAVESIQCDQTPGWEVKSNAGHPKLGEAGLVNY